MKVIDLTPEYEKLYFVCLEDWSSEMQEAGEHKAIWYEKMKDKGLKVMLAKDDDGVICGMIQYVPIAHSFAKGEDLYIVLCIWVHGHKQGIGDYRKRGIGKALLTAAEQDVMAIGAKGLAAWGMIIPVFMQAAWFKKQGYKVVDKSGIMALLLKSFSIDAKPPTIIKQKRKLEKIKGQVTVYAFKYGWCPVSNLAYERAKRACLALGDKVVFKEYDTMDEQIFAQWGIRDGLFVDNKEIRTGPPPSYEKIYQVIEKKAKKLK
jgi:GNAT superfamily N-acetyltransferase